MPSIKVVKRDGKSEALDLEKWHRQVAWACSGLTGVSISELELRANVQFHDGIKTSDITELTIKAAADMISEAAPNYAYVASRLINYNLRKMVYGDHECPRLFDHVKKVCDAGMYDKEVFGMYTEDQWDQIDSFVDHRRDYDITYVGMEQLRGKYLVRNRYTGEFFETPQMAFVLVAAVLFRKYDNGKRMKAIKNYYDAISTFDISIPTPIVAGVRTPTRQFASCVLIESGDSLDSINATATSVVKYAAKRAGLGISFGALRAVGSAIRNGEATHTGVVNFVKYFQAAVKSCNQGGIRAASCTGFFPWWHYEIEDLIVLKNEKGIEENRARHLDYGVQLNYLFYERVLSGQDLTLFSPADVPDLHDAFFIDQAKFKELYERAEKNPKIRKRKIPALELFRNIIQERAETGRIYIMNADHSNDHGAFLDPIRMSNLCVEINLPTTPVKLNGEGEIATCILSAINWGNVNEPGDFEKPAEHIVRALDELIDYQDYPAEQARLPALERRFIGVGIINFAYWMAKNGLSYQDIDKEGLRKIHEYAEAWSYYLIKASVELAKEKGPCKRWKDTKYGCGILPIDTYKKDVDDLTGKPKYHMDWGLLRADLTKYGIRNSTLMAIMPAESSAAISNSTNGIEPARALVAVKQSKDGVLRQVVPNVRRMKKEYDLLWDQKSPKGYLKICAVLQKFIDQSMSVNTSYNLEHYPDNQIPMSLLMEDVLFAYKYGLKSLYYHNTHDLAGEIIDLRKDMSVIEKGLKVAEAMAKDTEPAPDEEHDLDCCKL